MKPANIKDSVLNPLPDLSHSGEQLREKNVMNLRAARMLLASVSLILMMSVLRIEASAQCANPPGPYQITVWRNGNFEGDCKTLEIGRYPNSSFLSPVPNDQISSIKVGSKVRAHLFEHADFKGHVALYEAGSSHNVSASGFAGLGPGVNEKTTSIIVQETLGLRVPYLFVNDYPSDRETVWANEANGICHSDAYWFITQNRPHVFSATEPPLIYKIPLSADLNDDDPSVATAVLPSFLFDKGYDHMGDPDCIGGFIFVPLEHKSYSEPAAVAVFRASDLSFVTYDCLYANDDNHAGWLAFDPSNGEMWTSRTELCGGDYFCISIHSCPGGIQGMFKYAVDWTKVVPDGRFFLPGAGPTVVLKDRRGEPLFVKGMQGGVFDTSGEVFYLANSDRGLCKNPGMSPFPLFGYDGHGIWAFRKGTGDLIGESSNGYGPFRFTTTESPIFDENEEEQGLDYLPTNPSITPGISGQLHAMLLNNDVFESDNIYIKHYKQLVIPTIVVGSPLVIRCPANITITAPPGQDFAVVDLPPPLVNKPKGTIVIFSHPSGSQFPVGTTDVTVTAIDASGNTAACTFTVTVNLAGPPPLAVSCIGSLHVVVPHGQPRIVNYPRPVLNKPEGATLVCLPPAGSSFPVGTTVVTCTANNTGGETASCSFVVHVH